MSNTCRRSSLSAKFLESRSTSLGNDVTNDTSDVAEEDYNIPNDQTYKVTYDVTFLPSRPSERNVVENDDTLAVFEALHDKRGRKWESSLEDIGTCTASSTSSTTSTSSTISIYDDGDDENESDERNGENDNGFGSNTESQFDHDASDSYDIVKESHANYDINDSANESLTPTFGEEMERKKNGVHRHYKFPAANFANELIEDSNSKHIESSEFIPNLCQRNIEDSTSENASLYGSLHRNEVHIHNTKVGFYQNCFRANELNISSQGYPSSSVSSTQPNSLDDSNYFSQNGAKESMNLCKPNEFEDMTRSKNNNENDERQFSVVRNFFVEPNAGNSDRVFVSSLVLNATSESSVPEDSFTESFTDPTLSCFSNNESSNAESEESNVRRDIKSPGIKNEKSKTNSSKNPNKLSNCAKIKSKIKRRHYAPQPNHQEPSSKSREGGGELEIERTRNEPGRNERELTMEKMRENKVIERESSRKEREMEINKERVVVLRKEIQSKNAEIKDLKLRLKIEKDKIKDLLRLIEKGQQLRPGQEQISTSELRHLRRELTSLRQERETLKKQLFKKKEDEKKKEAFLKKSLLNEENKTRGIEEEMKREVAKNTRLIGDLEKSLKEQKKELEEKQKTIHKLECEKLYLGEEIYRITGFEEGFWSDAAMVSKN